MLMCDRVVLKKAGAFTACPVSVAVPGHRFVGAFIIKDLKAALVWPDCGQSERK
jgi:hypothetical protein